MGCLSMKLGALRSVTLSVRPVEHVRLDIADRGALTLLLGTNPPRLSLSPMYSMVLKVDSHPPVLSITNVCSVGLDEIYVLAATDGPLRTWDGGYILLDPAREQD